MTLGGENLVENYESSSLASLLINSERLFIPSVEHLEHVREVFRANLGKINLLPRYGISTI